MGNPTIVRKTEKTGEQLLDELTAEIRAQQAEDGGFRTPIHSESRKRRDAKLNGSWKGTAIAARVLEDGASAIVLKGVVHDSKERELVSFSAMGGVIEEVSCSYGGYIGMEHGSTIWLHHLSEDGKPPEDWQAGLEIDVIQAPDPTR